jgi:predicted dehydrogenase
MSDTLTRRTFAGAAGTAFMITRPETALGSQANSALTVGLVGAGRRGVAISGIFAKHEFARISAICDIYQDQLDAAAQKFSGAKQYRDINQLLASDLDAVYIATPPHLHPEHFELAVKARKHIFLEKPAGVDVAGCRRVVEAARKADKSKRISADYQQRYGKDYKKAYELVKSGELGRIAMVRGSWLGGGLPVRKGHPQAEEQMRNWLFYREKSGDIIVEQNCHNLDVVNWFMGAHPARVFGYGGRQVRKDIGNIMDNLAATFAFDNGVVFSYSANQFSQGNYRDVGEVFFCEKGVVSTSRTGVSVWREGQTKPEVWPTKYDITQDAVFEFVDGARSGKLENAGFYAAESTLTAILAREAIYAKKEMTWDGIAKGLTFA